MKGNIIYLSLGSNLGNRLQNLTVAREYIEKDIGIVQAVSGIYESAAWGYSSDKLFYNCCISAVTSLEPLPLLDRILLIEKNLGRIREGNEYTDRLIDMDLLFFGTLILDHIRLEIPHPAIGKRRFVLAPLSEIAPELVHPAKGLTVFEMLERCQDPVKVIRIG